MECLFKEAEWPGRDLLREKEERVIFLYLSLIQKKKKKGERGRDVRRSHKSLKLPIHFNTLCMSFFKEKKRKIFK
jgi:hypothetical protein